MTETGIQHRLANDAPGDRSEEDLHDAIAQSLADHTMRIANQTVRSICCARHLEIATGETDDLTAYPTSFEKPITFAKIAGMDQMPQQRTEPLIMEFVFNATSRMCILLSSMSDYKSTPRDRPVIWDSDTGLNAASQPIHPSMRFLYFTRMRLLTAYIQADNLISDVDAQLPTDNALYNAPDSNKAEEVLTLQRRISNAIR